MSTEVVRAGIVVFALSLRQEFEKRKKKRKSRKVWVKNWVARREKYGASNTLLQDPIQGRPLGGASGALAPGADHEGAPERRSLTGHTLIRSTVAR
jgi:hypothetical protein